MVLPAPFGPITPTMPPGGNLNERSSIEQRVAETLGEMRKFDDIVAEPLGHGNNDLRRRWRLVVLLGEEILIALDAGLGFGLARLGARRDPFGLGLELTPARLLLAAFLGEALLLLLQPGGIIALVGDAAAAIEFENPARDIVEKIAVVGDDQDRAGISAKVALQPVDRFRVEMICRLVEEQKLRLFEEQPAQRDAAALAAGKFFDREIAGRTAERVHRLIDPRIEVPKACSLDLVLQFGHFIGGRVRIVHGEFVVAIEDRLLFRDALNHIAANIEAVIERAAPAADSRRGRLRRRNPRRKTPCRSRP